MLPLNPLLLADMFESSTSRQRAALLPRLTALQGMMHIRRRQLSLAFQVRGQIEATQRLRPAVLDNNTRTQMTSICSVPCRVAQSMR